jgi:hypothetical protein
MFGFIRAFVNFIGPFFGMIFLSPEDGYELSLTKFIAPFLILNCPIADGGLLVIALIADPAPILGRLFLL